MRKRDERFKDQARYKGLPDPVYDKAHPKKAAKHYRPHDFSYDPASGRGWRYVFGAIRNSLSVPVVEV